jgi:hypothetical protein
MPGIVACWQKNVTPGTLDILKLKPFGDRGLSPAGIDIVILLFRKKKKGDPKVPL